MALRRINNQSWGEVEQVHDELIRTLRLDTERPKNISRKIAHVPSDNHARATPNGSGQYMPVVRIRQTQTLSSLRSR